MFPRAYLLTWCCYGARLHGDERGTVDRTCNVFGTPRLPANGSRVDRDRRQMSEPPLVLTEAMRGIVTRTIAEHTTLRGWELLCVNVRTTHAHVVVSASLDPESVMGQYKAWASRRMREANLLESREQVWTPHGSTRYLWEIEDTYDAVHYVRNMQE